MSANFYKLIRCAYNSGLSSENVRVYNHVMSQIVAALLAAAGVVIGAAWGGLLANFAAGVFLIVFRPFQVGDFICAAGITRTVQEIGLFITSIYKFDQYS